ncbi:hypothetical protein HYH03_011138 [Edaphochlamys debaryana]|uniref:Uncharacterized protein n=1 Tax=Edaphochlamys debaryana TaxID=47281 RepID=A0A835XSQ7_9CHLO|nr:hypothetical protein HYH03_011138 [Edaphochlamys debaryana]|eukprot:KAG2490517.1 hypothetical protein HYH03_011138 [Edaphochlamys debaryana]
MASTGGSPDIGNNEAGGVGPAPVGALGPDRNAVNPAVDHEHGLLRALRQVRDMASPADIAAAQRLLDKLHNNRALRSFLAQPGAAGGAGPAAGAAQEVGPNAFRNSPPGGRDSDGDDGGPGRGAGADVARAGAEGEDADPDADPGPDLGAGGLDGINAVGSGGIKLLDWQGKLCEILVYPKNDVHRLRQKLSYALRMAQQNVLARSTIIPLELQRLLDGARSSAQLQEAVRAFVLEFVQPLFRTCTNCNARRLVRQNPVPPANRFTCGHACCVFPVRSCKPGGWDEAEDWDHLFPSILREAAAAAQPASVQRRRGREDEDDAPPAELPGQGSGGAGARQGSAASGGAGGSGGQDVAPWLSGSRPESNVSAFSLGMSQGYGPGDDVEGDGMDGAEGGAGAVYGGYGQAGGGGGGGGFRGGRDSYSGKPNIVRRIMTPEGPIYVPGFEDEPLPPRRVAPAAHAAYPPGLVIRPNVDGMGVYGTGAHVARHAGVVLLPDGNLLIPIDQAGADRGDGDPYRAAARMAGPQLVRLGPGGPTAMAMGPTHQHQHQHVRNVLDVGLLPDDGRLGMHGAQQLPQIQIQHQIQQQQQQLQLLRQLQQQLQSRLSQDAGVQQARALAGLPPGTRIVRLPDGQLAAVLGPVGDGEDLPGPGLAHRHSEERHADPQGAPGPFATTNKPRLQPVQSFPMPTAFAYPPESAFRQQPPPQPTQPPTAQRKQAQQPRSKPPAVPQDEEDEEYEIITLPDGRKARILPDKPAAPRAAAAAAAGSGRDGSTAHEGRLAAGEDDGEEGGGGGGQSAAADAAAEAEDGGDDGPTWHHRSTRPAGRGGRAGGSGGGGSQLNMVPSTSTVLSPTPGATTTITAGATALTAATEVSPAPPPPLPQPRVVRLPDGRVFLLDPLPQDAAAAAAATGDDGDGDGGDADGSGGGQEGGVRRGSGGGPRSPPLPPPPRPLGRATPAGSEGSLGSGERPAAAATAAAAKGGATTSTTSSGSRLATAVLGMVPVATVGAPDGSNRRTVVVRRLLLQPLSFSPEEIGVDPGELPLVHMGPVVDLQPAAGRAAAAAAMADAAVDGADDDDGGGGDGDVITSARDLPPEPPPPRRAANAQAQVQQPDRQAQQPDRQAQQQQLIEQLLMKPLRSEGAAPPGGRPHAAAAANAAAAASAAARAANAAARAAADDAAGDDDVVMLDPQDAITTTSAAYRDALQRAQRQQLQQLQLQQLQQLQQQQQQAALVQQAQAQLLLLQQQRDREQQLATARQQQQQQQQQQLQRALRQQQQAALAAAQQVQQAAASMHVGPGTGAGTDRSGHGLSHAHSAVHRRSSRDAVPQLPLLTEEELAQAAPEDWQAYIGSLLEVAALQLPQDLPYDAVPRPAYGVRPGFLLRAMQFDPPGARPWSTRLVLRGARSVAAAGPAAVAGLFSSAVYDSDLITLCCDVPTDIVQTGVKLPAAIAVTDLRPRKELPVTGLQGSPLLMWPSPEAHAPQLAAFSRLGLARIALVARLDERCDLVICPQEMSGILLVVGAVIRRTNGGGGGQVQGRSGAKSAAALAAPAGALPPELPSVPTLDGSGGSVNSGPSAGRKRPAEAQPGPAAARGAPTARVETPNLADLATAAGKAAAAATASTTASMYSTARFQPPQNPVTNITREQKDGAGAGPATAGVGARGAGAGAGALASGSYAVPLVAPSEPTRPPAAVATTQHSEPGAGAGKKPTGSAGAAGPTPGPAGSKRPPGYDDALGLLMALASTMAQGGKRASGGPGPGPGPAGAQKGPPTAAAPSDPRRPPPPLGPAAEARPQAGDGPGAAPRPAASQGQADGAEAEADAGPKAVDADMEAAPAAEAEAGQADPNPNPNPSPNAEPDPDPEVQEMEAEGAETAAGAEAEEGQAPAAADPEADADVAIDLAQDPDPGADPETETDPDIETAEVEMTGPAEAEPEATEGQGLAGSPPAAGPAEHPEAEPAEDAAEAEGPEAEAAAAGHPAEAEAPEAPDPMQIDGADCRVEDEEEDEWSDLDVQIVQPGADRAAWDGPDRGPAGDAEVAERERDPDPDPAAAQAPQPPGPPGPAADAVADEAAVAAPQDEAVAAAAAADAEVGQGQGPGPAAEEEEGAKAGRAGAPAGSPDGLWDDDEGFV